MMGIEKFLLNLPQFLILLPGAASLYLPAKNQMKFSPAKTAFLCLAVILPYAVTAALLCLCLSMDVHAILLASLPLFFFLYRRTVDLNLSCSLAIYVGVCAIETFPAQFGYAFDAWLHPSSGASKLSPEAALFQFGISVLLLAAFAYPATHHFQRAVDSPGFSRIWYFTVVLSSVFLLLNVLSVPQSYRTLHAGRMLWIFPMFEVGMFAMLVSVYVLFYRGTIVILEHAELLERTRLLEMQSHQYHILQEHMRQTAKLRHDFRHSVRLLSTLAEKGDTSSIRAHLAEYDTSLAKNAPMNYCANAALNALFGYYHEMAVQAEIRTDWHIELPEPLPFSSLIWRRCSGISWKMPSPDAVPSARRPGISASPRKSAMETDCISSPPTALTETSGKARTDTVPPNTAEPASALPRLQPSRKNTAAPRKPPTAIQNFLWMWP